MKTNRKLTRDQEAIMEHADKPFNAVELYRQHFQHQRFSTWIKKVYRLKKRGLLIMIKPGLYERNLDNQKSL